MYDSVANRSTEYMALGRGVTTDSSDVKREELVRAVTVCWPLLLHCCLAGQGWSSTGLHDRAQISFSFKYSKRNSLVLVRLNSKE